VLGLVQDEPGAARRLPQAASWTRPVRGAPPEAGRLQGMVLLISPRNASWVLRPDRRRPKAAIAPHPEAVRVQLRMSPDVGRYKQLVQRLGRCFPGKRLSRP
jgi:hypothetical protein